MKAAVFHGRGDVRVETLADPTPARGEVVLEVYATGICGTDAHEFAHGPTMFPITREHPVTHHRGPMVPGHELTGVVVARGGDVTQFQEGQLLACGAGYSCGTCAFCRSGRSNQCAQYATVGLQRDGGLAEFCAVPATACVPVTDASMPPDVVALVQPVAIAHHAARRGRIAPGEDAVVIGVGGIGAFLTHVLVQLGARVCAIDLDADRLALARSLGAAATIAGGDAAATAALVQEAGFAPEVVYEVTGSDPGAATALAVARPTTRVVLVGLQSRPFELDARALTLREFELIGTNAHAREVDLPAALRMLSARTDPWDDVAPAAIALEELVSGGLLPLSSGQSGAVKVLVDPRAGATRPTEMAWR